MTVDELIDRLESTPSVPHQDAAEEVRAARDLYLGVEPEPAPEPLDMVVMFWPAGETRDPVKLSSADLKARRDPTRNSYAHMLEAFYEHRPRGLVLVTPYFQ